MQVRHALAGALLTNAIPHTIMGLAGQRCTTPLGGVSSGPAANLAWAGINLLAGVAALGPRRWRGLDQREADQRLRAVTLGFIGMAVGSPRSRSPVASRHVGTPPRNDPPREELR